MGRSLSPIVQRELENLDKDADSRRSAMKALKSYVKDLDSKAIPLFLAQVSRTKETGSVSGECTISLYEVLARVHGVKIVPLIDNIMTTIIKTLASSAGSFPLQQACSKVVPAIARYGIDPTTPEDKKRRVIHSLCNPLSDALLGSQESLTSGAALCIKALVDSDNWRFASDEMVNKVCQNVAGALEEKSTQTNAHMGLVMALAKRNAVVVEPYARLLMQAGLRILNAGILNVGVVEGNSQKRFSAIQMISFLMKSLDPWSICSELQLIIEEMEKCQSDQMAYVSGAAFEALQTAKRIAADKGSKFEKNHGSVTGSNFSRRRYASHAGDQSPSSMSPESQTLSSFVEYDAILDSSNSSSLVSRNIDFDRRSANRKLWSYENGGVDVSLKDGLFSEVQASDTFSTFSEHFENNGISKQEEDYENEFAGFIQRNPRNGMSRSTTSSPLRSRAPISADNFIFRTPRRLVHSLQDQDNVNSVSCGKQNRRFRSQSLSNNEWSPASRYDGNGIICGTCHEFMENGSSYAGGEQFQNSAESVSSTDDIPADSHLQMSCEVVHEQKNETQRDQQQKTENQRVVTNKHFQKRALKLVCGLSFALVAVVAPMFLSFGLDDDRYLVPT